MTDETFTTLAVGFRESAVLFASSNLATWTTSSKVVAPTKRVTFTFITQDPLVLPAERDWVGHRNWQPSVGRSSLACMGHMQQHRPLELLSPRSSGFLVPAASSAPGWIRSTFERHRTSFKESSDQDIGFRVTLPSLVLQIEAPGVVVLSFASRSCVASLLIKANTSW